MRENGNYIIIKKVVLESVECSQEYCLCKES